MPNITPEIQEAINKVKKWEIGAGVFKEGTPEDIIALNKEILAWFSKTMDGVQ